MKPYYILVFLITSISQFVAGQNRKLTDSVLNNSTAHKIKFATPPNCSEIEEWIKADISKKTIFLFLQGGIAPVVYSSDKKFEDTYGVYFYDFGCVAMPDDKCVIKYNSMVFDYLTSIYGKKWQRKIRKDVIGFTEWKKNKLKSQQ